MNTYLIASLKVIDAILTAAIAMTAFSLVLFLLQFLRRRQRLAWAFVPLLGCITVIYSADALETLADSSRVQMLMQKVHWTGFIFLPAVFLYFCTVLLSQTGVHHGKRGNIFGILLMAASVIFVRLLWTDKLFTGIRNIPMVGSTMICTKTMNWFWVYFVLLLIPAFASLGIAYTRTKTRTGKRRMTYLIAGSMGILLGTFPLLLFGSGLLIAEHKTVFWLLSVFANIAIEVMIIILGYSVATLSVPWSDRQVRFHMIEWLLRGPLTASITLGVVTVINRGSGVFGFRIDGLNTFACVFMIIMLEFLVGILMPHLEQSSLVGYGTEDYTIYTQLSRQMVFKRELSDYLEGLLSELCDIYQAKGGFICVFRPDGSLGSVTRTGRSVRSEEEIRAIDFTPFVQGEANSLSVEEESKYLPILHENVPLAVMHLTDLTVEEMLNENSEALEDALDNIREVLWQRRYLTNAYRALKESRAESHGDSFRSTNALNTGELLPKSDASDTTELSAWVKDAMSQFWGGPRLAESPLLEFDIVRNELNGEDDTRVNALRRVLKKALEKIRPEGEREFTNEWTLYNILDLKFIEKLKVKDIARKLSISEADFYRKQKVALSALADAIREMEHPNE